MKLETSSVKTEDSTTAEEDTLEIPMPNDSPPSDHITIRMANTEYHYKLINKSSSQPPSPESKLKPFYITIFYNAEQKRKILKLLQKVSIARVYNLCNGKITIATLGKWKRQAQRSGFTDRRLKYSRINYPEFDQKVYEWFRKQRAKQLPISRKDIIKYASDLLEAKPENTNLRLSSFSRWITDFLNRYKLVRKFRTRIDYGIEKQTRKFYQVLNKKTMIGHFDDYWNFDEIDITFELPSRHSAKHRNDKSEAFSINSFNKLSSNSNIIKKVDGFQKIRAKYLKMTIIIMISASGKMVSPILIYHSKNYEPFSLPDYPDVIIKCSKTGHNTESMNYEEILPILLNSIKKNRKYD